MPLLESAVLSLIMGFFHVNTEEKTTFAYEHPQKSIELFGVFFWGWGIFFGWVFGVFFHIKRKHPALQRCIPALRCLCSPHPLAEPTLSMSFPHPHVVVCSLALIPHNQSVTELAISSCPCVSQQHARLLSPIADTSTLGP